MGTILWSKMSENWYLGHYMSKAIMMQYRYNFNISLSVNDYTFDTHYFDLTTEGIWVSRDHLKPEDIREIFLIDNIHLSAKSAAEELTELLLGD